MRTHYYYNYYKMFILQCYHHNSCGPGNFTKFISKTVAQLNADVCRRSERTVQVSRMTDDKGETWSPFGLSKVRSRPESPVADCSMPVLQPPERCGRSTSQRHMQCRGVSRAEIATMSDVAYQMS